jgi:peptidyl-dipeptidase Dcp
MSDSTSQNPLFDLSLPFGMPAFDQIRNDDFGPAFESGMQSHRLEIDRIANAPAKPTFANTIEALERAGSSLDRVARIYFNLTSAHTNEQLEALQRVIAPKLAAHSDSIMLDHRLFKRISTLYDIRDSLELDHESERLLERYYLDFVRSGANLNETDKERLTAINAELASLSTQFSQNVLKATNDGALVLDHEEQLAGLSADEIKQAADAGAELGQPGKFVLALSNTTEQPLETVLAVRATRQKLRAASEARCLQGEFDNRPVVLKSVRLRAERARLLGYQSHAAYILEDETAKTTDAVNQLLASLAPRAAANAHREAAALQQRIAADGETFKLEASDWSFYSERVKRDKYAFDESEIRPYLELERVLKDGLFYAATRLYGITFKERFDLPLYHPDVRSFEVFNADGSTLALFLTDFFARPSKRGGAWMNEYVGRSRLVGSRPVVGNHLNVPKPAPGAPALLTLTELTTLFHEFGHALHGMFSDVQYPLFAGTHVPRDFVEFPSQVNEMWALWPEVFNNYAKHYQSGEPLPASLVDKVRASDTFNQGFATTEYLAAAILDQAWHQLTPEQIPADVEAFEHDALAKAGILVPQVSPRYRTCYFSHIFAGGYGAGYYAYIWSEILDADAGDWFREHAGLSRSNGDWFRDTLLSRGGSQDASTMYRTFRGRDAIPDALLKRRGLNATDS